MKNRNEYKAWGWHLVFGLLGFALFSALMIVSNWAIDVFEVSNAVNFFAFFFLVITILLYFVNKLFKKGENIVSLFFKIPFEKLMEQVNSFAKEPSFSYFERESSLGLKRWLSLFIALVGFYITLYSLKEDIFRDNEIESSWATFLTLPWKCLCNDDNNLIDMSTINLKCSKKEKNYWLIVDKRNDSIEEGWDNVRNALIEGCITFKNDPKISVGENTPNSILVGTYILNNFRINAKGNDIKIKVSHINNNGGVEAIGSNSFSSAKEEKDYEELMIMNRSSPPKKLNEPSNSSLIGVFDNIIKEVVATESKIQDSTLTITIISTLCDEFDSQKRELISRFKKLAQEKIQLNLIVLPHKNGNQTEKILTLAEKYMKEKVNIIDLKDISFYGGASIPRILKSIGLPVYYAEKSIILRYEGEQLLKSQSYVLLQKDNVVIKLNSSDDYFSESMSGVKVEWGNSDTILGMLYPNELDTIRVPDDKKIRISVTREENRYPTFPCYQLWIRPQNSLANIVIPFHYQKRLSSLWVITFIFLQLMFFVFVIFMIRDYQTQRWIDVNANSSPEEETISDVNTKFPISELPD